MKFKEYEFDMSSVPRLLGATGYRYPKIRIPEFFESFKDIFGEKTITEAIRYLDIYVHGYVTEEDVEKALDYKEYQERALREEQERSIREIERKEAELIDTFKSAFAVYIDEFDASFVVPFDINELPQELVAKIGHGKVFPAQSLIGILQNRVLYRDGKPFAPDYCLNHESANWISNWLNDHKIKFVSTAAVTKNILTASKEYVTKAQSPVAHEKLNYL